MNKIKAIIKEVKRVRFPSGKVTFNTFWKSLIFIIISSLVLFLVTAFFMFLWTVLGIGANK